MHPAVPEPEGEAPQSLAQSRAVPGAVDRLSHALQGIDLTSADGRAGIGALLAEIERLSPGALLRQAAGIELGRVEWARSGSEAPRTGR